MFLSGYIGVRNVVSAEQGSAKYWLSTIANDELLYWSLESY